MSSCVMMILTCALGIRQSSHTASAYQTKARASQFFQFDFLETKKCMWGSVGTTTLVQMHMLRRLHVGGFSSLHHHMDGISRSA